MKRFLVLVLAVALVSALLLVGCGPSPAPTPSPSPTATAPSPTAKPSPAAGPIKIGAILDMTGRSARWGPLQKAGIEMSLERVGYKAAGREIQLIVEDSAGDAANTSSKAKKLVELDKINILIGPLNNAYVMGLVPYLAENKIPEIGISQGPIEWKEYPWVFTPPGPSEEIGYYMGQYTGEKLGYKTAVTLGSDFVSGYKIVGSWVNAFKAKGGKEIVGQGWTPLGIQDFSPYLTSLKTAEVCGAWAVPLKVMIKQYHDFGLGKKMPLIAIYIHEITEEDLTELGEPALGTIGSGLYNIRIDTPENKKFVADYQKKYNRYPCEWDMLGHDAADIAVAALESTKGDTTPDKLRDAIQNVKMNLLTGPFSFTPSHFGTRNIYIVKNQLEGGKPGWTILDKYTINPDALPPAPSTK